MRTALAVDQPAAPRGESIRTGRHDEVRRLSSLLEISQALSSTLQLKSGLHNVLDILLHHHQARHAVVTVVQDDGELHVEAFDGLGRSSAVSRKGVGAQSAARVIATGRPVVMPHIGGHARPVSLVCVPLALTGTTVGALSIELTCGSQQELDRAVTFYGIAGSMIAQAIKIQRFVEHDRRRLETANSRLRQELRERYDFSRIIGASPAVRAMYENLAQVAAANTTVLIRGESGTGKELIAQAIHYNSLRARKPFVKVSCAALPDSLIESELFGHERGAFTDAITGRKGRFELAEGGTLFLDEIGDVNPGVQIKLLRVLQQREFERLGGTETIKSNVRIVAATNRNLEVAVAQGDFREDLYYRLNAFAIVVPPLRERKTDLPLLVDHFLEKLSRHRRETVRRVSPQAIRALMSYHWPGNVRELENVLERAAIVCDGDVLHAYHLPPSVQTAETSGEIVHQSLSQATQTYERGLLEDAIKKTRGNRAKAARLLNTTERIMNRRVKDLGIDYKRFRA